MTPQEIAAYIMLQTTFTEETLAPLYEYRRAKRATGAPVDLECAILHAARECQSVADVLRDHLKRAAQEAADGLSAVMERGVRFGLPTWFALDGRVDAEEIAQRLYDRRAALQALVEAWAAIADRIVATDEDRARMAEEKRACRIAELSRLPVRELRAMARYRGLNGTGKDELAAALAAAEEAT